MQELHSLELSALLDMLAEHTDKCVRLFKEGRLNEDYAKSKELIEQVIAEIELRRSRNPVITKS